MKLFKKLAAAALAAVLALADGGLRRKRQCFDEG